MSQFFRLLRGEEGQAVVEYVLTLAVALSIISVIAIGFRRILMRMWEDFTQKIVGASPTAPRNSAYRFR